MFSGEYNTFPFIPENKSFFFENHFREKNRYSIDTDERKNERAKKGRRLGYGRDYGSKLFRKGSKVKRCFMARAAAWDSASLAVSA